METLVLIIGICVAICAMALLLQIWAWIALAASAQRMFNVFSNRARHFAPLRASVTATLRENREELRNMTRAARDLVAIVRRETAAVKGVKSDAERHYVAERERAELAYGDLKERAAQTAEVVETGIAEPWREVADFLRGVELGYAEVAPELQEKPKEAPRHRPAA